MTRLARWCLAHPLELAGQAGTPADLAAFDRLLATAAHAPGVASATNHRAVTAGQAHSTRIVAAAAGIMDGTVTGRRTCIPRAT